MACLAAAVALSALSYGAATKVEMDVSYMADGVDSLGFMTYDDSLCTSTSKCPLVVIVQDWNGMNEYEKERACMVADMGYVAFAADIYGVNTPKTTMAHWMAASGMHRQNMTMYMSKIHGAIAKAMSYAFVDSAKIAAMGYCFGGTGLINLALAGHSGVPGVQFPSGLLGVVSYHGGLTSGWLQPVPGSRPQLLLHSGGKDDSNGHIMNLTDDLESVSASYSISRYGHGVVHSFTEWSSNSPPMAMYSPMADQRSWEATERFFKELFQSGGSTPTGKPVLATVPSNFVHMMVNYTAAGVACQGFVIYDSAVCTSTSKCPAVVIIQDWTGMDDYEKQRAYLVAKEGYVAFAADIYGVDTPKMTMQDWMAASTMHRQDAKMYMDKIHGAVARTMAWDVVDTSKMAAIGYCFGGTGLINLALAGHSGMQGVAAFPTGLKGVVSFHGGLGGLVAPISGGTRPKVLILAGAKDTSISNAAVSNLTDDLESVKASYEITRYGPGVVHSFTHWGQATRGNSGYDATADFRSWYDMKKFFKEIFSSGTMGTQKSAVCSAHTQAPTSAPTFAPTSAPVVSAATVASAGVAALVLLVALAGNGL
mmetsp:Transcript_66861/g.207067  ORF Transcript_66861/g.207067 Transcript_66861/m.207067 type:complete len:594 (+) Transcript_66861:100-1881(+)